MPEVREVRGAEAAQPYVACRLGDEEYAVEVSHVQEIVRPTAITAVPRAPHYVEGVLNLRGRVVPVVDLARRFGMPARERTKATRIVITQMDARTVGMLVDAVSEVVRLGPDQISPAPDLARSGLNAEFFTGVGQANGRLLILLDLPRVLSKQEGDELPGGEAEA